MKIYLAEARAKLLEAFEYARNRLAWLTHLINQLKTSN